MSMNSLRLVAGLLIVSGLLAAKPAKGEPREERVQKVRVESSAGIVTEVERETNGSLQASDAQHASLLAAHLIQDLRDAQLALDDDNAGAAETQLKKAGDLIGIIRRLLPETRIKVSVKDKQGKVLYEDTHVLPLEPIQVAQSVLVVDLLRPIIDAKNNDDEVSGVQLTESEVISTRIVVNVDFIARRIREAQRLLKDKSQLEQAQEALTEAFEDGVKTTTNRLEEPLVEVREALWYAHRAVNSRHYEEASANLATARKHLAIFHDLLPADEQKAVAELQKEIEVLGQQLRNPSLAEAAQTAKAIEQALGRLLRWVGKSGAKPMDKPAETESKK
jgi:hypothetical protein